MASQKGLRSVKTVMSETLVDIPALSQTVASDTTITEIKTSLVNNTVNFKLYFKFMAKPTTREKLINLNGHTLPIYSY